MLRQLWEQCTACKRFFNWLRAHLRVLRSRHYKIERGWGVFDPAMDPTRDSTYKFLDSFIDEMTELFPDHYFHIGGDEVNGKEWDANKKVQEFKREHQIKSNADLQAYFSGR